MKWILVLIFLTGIACAQNTNHSFTDGNDLREACGRLVVGQPGFAAGHCFGLLEGYFNVVEAAPVPDFPTHCVPGAVTWVELAKVVVKYLDEHHEKLHLPAVLLISQATHDAFPCSAKTK